MLIASRFPLSGALLVVVASSVAGLSCSAPKKGADSRYVCPMHPEVQADKAADCTICGMKLVVVEKPREMGGAPPATAGSPAGPRPGHRGGRRRGREELGACSV